MATAQAAARKRKNGHNGAHLNGRNGANVQARLTSLREDLDALQHDIGGLVTDVGDVASEQASEAVERVSEWSNENLDGVRQAVRTQPLAACVLSMSAGAIIGALLLR
ncbi:MAG TPA: hypothetical protein VNH44_18400 [Micropepsaceae bacterium]|nr:hypothetical protein [Micropepsaceae bacterium]